MRSTIQSGGFAFLVDVGIGGEAENERMAVSASLREGGALVPELGVIECALERRSEPPDWLARLAAVEGLVVAVHQLQALLRERALQLGPDLRQRVR